MPRLIDWPDGLMWRARAPVSGPRAVGAGQSESASGYVQTVASPFGLWRFQFTFPPMQRRAARAFAGLVTALHAGANAVRVPLFDPDGPRLREAGVEVAEAAISSGLPWADTGLPFAETDRNWGLGFPPCAILSAAAKGATVLELDPEGWGGAFPDVGTMIGIAPLHFGAYLVTEIFDPGVFRIWPPLRKAVSEDDVATLTPVLAMRLLSESDGSFSRDLSALVDPVLTLTEVEDEIVRTHFEA